MLIIENEERSIIVLGEHYSQILNNVNGDLKSLSREEHIILLNKRVDMLKTLNEWAEQLGPASRRSRGFFFILERFHLNHRITFEDDLTSPVEMLEEKLVELGSKCVLLTIENNLTERVKSRNPKLWFEKTDEEITDYVNRLVEVQNRFKEAGKESKVETLEINTYKKEWNRFAEEIFVSMDYD